MVVKSHSSTECWNGRDSKKEAHRKREGSEGSMKREENKEHKKARDTKE